MKQAFGIPIQDVSWSVVNNEGICALSLIDLLGRTQQLKATHHVALRLSYIEIYNEVIKDILVSEGININHLDKSL